jgi:hypothetical protein
MIIYCSIKSFVEIKWAVNSAGECHPHTVEVAGSNPAPPTMHDQGVYETIDKPLFLSVAYSFCTMHCSFCNLELCSMYALIASSF